MVLIPASSLQLIWTSSRRGYIITWHPPTSCERYICTQFNPSTDKLIPCSHDIFDRMHLLFTQVHFFFWQLGWGQYVTLSISKTIQIRRTRHAGHYWRTKDEPISDVLPWTLSHGRSTVGRPARTYRQHFVLDTGCSLKNLPGAMDDRDGWRERGREIRASSTTLL